jgi:xanthine/uracil permease
MAQFKTWKVGVLGLQHVLAMYAGAVIVPLIVGPAIGMDAGQLAYLISIDLFTCGIATLLQVIGGRHFGIRLPVILGCTFTAVAPMIAIGKLEGITAIYGAIIVSCHGPFTVRGQNPEIFPARCNRVSCTHYRGVADPGCDEQCGRRTWVERVWQSG